MVGFELELSPEAFREELETVKDHRRALKARDHQLARHQSWLEQGIEYADSRTLAGSHGGQPEKVVSPETIFDASSSKPTIRQAVVLVMIASPSERLWRPAEVINEIDHRGWLPKAKTARQMVRNRMLSMVEKGELVRREPGRYYQLASDIRAAGL